MERAREFKCPLAIVKCDIMKAFDRIKHSTILEALERHKVHPPVVRACARELLSARCAVRTPEGLLTDDIPQSRGVRQGGCSSPALFVLALACLLQDLVESWKERKLGFCLHEFYLGIACFADDIVLCAPSVGMLELMLNSWF